MQEPKIERASCDKALDTKPARDQYYFEQNKFVGFM